MKALLAAVLRPCLRWHRLGQRWRQLLGFVRLSARLPAPLHPSNVVQGCPELHGTLAIAFGRDSLLYPDIYLETREHGRICLGDGVVLSRGVHLVAYSGIELGEGTMIGEYASVRDANHVRDAGLPLRDAGHQAKPIRIGRQVWIGRGAVVLAGVTIGDRAVVGANAVVTHDVAAGEVVVGAPARPILARSAT